jgi:hypothetical protein
MLLRSSLLGPCKFAQEVMDGHIDVMRVFRQAIVGGWGASGT